MNETTVQKMKQMKFYGMLRAFRTSMEAGKLNQYTADEMIEFLIESEWDDRQNRKIQRGLTNAKFRYKASIENIIITGSTGVGKSYLASAIGHQACINGYKVIYANTAKLIAKLKMAKADDSYVRELARMEKQDLLILDDFGIQPFDAQGRAALMEIIEDRYDKSSFIITSQVPVKQWYDIIGEKTIADAILDRIVHDACRLELKGESLRKRKTQETETINE